MWILYAFSSAFFAGITSIMAKIGMKDTDSDVATALRTTVILGFSWASVFIMRIDNQLSMVAYKSLMYLILSGLSTGASWICYFRALQLGNINKIVPIDKSSVILTMLLAFIFLKEPISILGIIAMITIGIGTYLMIQRKKTSVPEPTNNNWLIFALLSAVFASLTAILGKIGIENIDPTLGTAIRTVVILPMAWLLVFIQKKNHLIKDIDRRSMLFIIVSGFSTSISWLCYYYALQNGKASIVVPIDKLSIIVTIVFSYFFLKEKLSQKSIIGLVLIVIGTLLLLI